MGMQVFLHRPLQKRLMCSLALLSCFSLLQNMSHEIRTPANAIIGATQLLRFTTMSDDQQDLVNTVWNGSKHLLSVTAASLAECCHC